MPRIRQYAERYALKTLGYSEKEIRSFAREWQ